VRLFGFVGVLLRTGLFNSENDPYVNWGCAGHAGPPVRLDTRATLITAVIAPPGAMGGLQSHALSCNSPSRSSWTPSIGPAGPSTNTRRDGDGAGYTKWCM
jgi:hypothetical protein